MEKGDSAYNIPKEIKLISLYPYGNNELFFIGKVIMSQIFS